MTERNMVEARGICKSFGRKEARVEALRGVSLAIREGEMAAIMGKSGSGKSTLLNILGGMMSVDGGEYLYDGKPVNFRSQKALTRFRRDEVGFVVQYFALVDDLNVYQNVALPLKYQGLPEKKVRERVMGALRELGIEDKAKAYPSELSGGQQQRAAIARAVVKQPRMVLADEPTGALDESTGEGVLEIFRQLNRNGKTVIIVTHDPKVAKGCQRIIRLKDGMVLPAGVAGEEKGQDAAGEDDGKGQGPVGVGDGKGQGVVGARDKKGQAAVGAIGKKGQAVAGGEGKKGQGSVSVGDGKGQAVAGGEGKKGQGPVGVGDGKGQAGRGGVL